MEILEDIGIRYAGIFFFYIKKIIAKKNKKEKNKYKSIKTYKKV